MKAHYVLRFNNSAFTTTHDSLETAIIYAEKHREAAVLTDNYTIEEVKTVYYSDPHKRYRSDHDGLLHK